MAILGAGWMRLAERSSSNRALRFGNHDQKI
jgi:hypothetical protein